MLLVPFYAVMHFARDGNGPTGRRLYGVMQRYSELDRREYFVWVWVMNFVLRDDDTLNNWHAWEQAMYRFTPFAFNAAREGARLGHRPSYAAVYRR